MKPRLVAVAHGTRHTAGPPTIRALTGLVRRRLPNVEVVESYVELAEPTFTSVMESTEAASVVVPLLLSTGYHITHDLPASASLSRHGVTITRPLGPHPLVAAAMGMRLRAAGALRGDAVVLVATGSRDPAALVETVVAGRLLQAHWGAPVRVATLSGEGADVGEAIAGLRNEGHRRVAVAPYLLAPGFFASKAYLLATVSGATMVADVLGPHPLVAELVVRRYLATTRSLTGSSLRRVARVA